MHKHAFRHPERYFSVASLLQYEERRVQHDILDSFGIRATGITDEIYLHLHDT